MTVPTPRPSRLLKLVSATAPWVLGLVLGVWLVFGLAWAALHGWIVPRIGEFRPRIEAGLTRVLGTPLRIGAISAQGGPLVPSFEIRDVVLLDHTGREALRLGRVVALLSPRSLARLGFEQLVVEAPTLDLRRDAQGRLHLAGLPLGGESSGEHNRFADWVFSQRELVVRNATVRWSDALARSADVELREADLVIRNGSRRHLLRLDATPPSDWGARFSLRATMRQSLLNPRRGNWREWQGQVYADLPRLNLALLRPQFGAATGLAPQWQTALQSGQGAVRLWADLVHGEWLGGTLDLALRDVSARIGRPDAAPLALSRLQGRLRARQLAGGLELASEHLQVAGPDGTPWPGGEIFFSSMRGESRVPGQGVLRAERVDLAALAQAASRLPLAPELRKTVAGLAPRGQVEQLHVQWDGRIESPAGWRLRGRVHGLALAAGPMARPQPGNLHPLGRPGVRGLDAQFDLTQSGGQATLAMRGGALEFPGVFEQPAVPLDQLAGELRWQVEGERLAVQVPALRFANTDAEGELQARWHSHAGPVTAQRPGVLELGGALRRADATRVHRYLPLELGAEVRHYVRDAVQQGRADQVRFNVKGDLHDFPFRNPQQGEFRIAADVRDVQYAFVPPTLQAAGELPWPALTQLAGELVFEGNGMRVRAATGRLGALAVPKVEADIADFGQSRVDVRAEARAALSDMLHLVRRSPLAAMSDNALAQASATGAAELKLQLALPLADLSRSKVQGALALPGNDLQLQPGTPLLARTRGNLQFSESGFLLAGVQTRVFGGDVRLEGGTRPAGSAPQVQLRAQGVATAEGLRQATELGALARLAQRASGSAAYTAVLGLRDGEPEISIASSLQGLALDLPAPLAKPAEANWPLRVERSLVPAATAATAPVRQEQWRIDLGTVLGATLVRDLTGEKPAVRAALGVGLLPGESAPLPESGVFANVRLGEASLDAWQTVLRELVPPAADSHTARAGSLLPDRFVVRADTLTLGGRTLHALVLGGSRDASVWRANVQARELDGYVEYRQGADAGRVRARLARLTIARGDEDEVTTLLDEQPASVPALDVVVDDFELRGKRLGRLEMEAVNRGGGRQAEWRLNRLSLAMPEARFSASGNWAALGAQAAVPRGRAEARRTAMNFRLDIEDAGALLARLGMQDVVRRGHGRLEGQVGWVGSPLALDHGSLSGDLHVDVQGGQFLKADPGLAKLLGVLSLQSLPRRLTLDFRDVFSEGFSFDFVRGDVRIAQGMASTNNLQMKGVNAAVLMDGQADIARETQDLRVVVVPEINAGTASLVATAINPAIGIGTFLAQWFLRRPLMEAATQQFHIDGSWGEPRIERVARSARTEATDGVVAPEIAR